jgi:hypothetical protein
MRHYWSKSRHAALILLRHKPNFLPFKGRIEVGIG